MYKESVYRPKLYRGIFSAHAEQHGFRNPAKVANRFGIIRLTIPV